MKRKPFTNKRLFRREKGGACEFFDVPPLVRSERVRVGRAFASRNPFTC